MSKKEVVLVTGASSGLGQAIAEYLKEDYTVYGTSRKAQNGEEKNGIRFLQLDVCDDQSVQTAIDYLLEQEQRIDYLINNAGVGIAGSIEETSQSMVREVFETNFHGVVRMCQAVLPAMRKQRNGCIINISSIGGEISLPYRGYYSASKAAVESISESMRMEVKPFGIRVAVLQPGDFNTNISTSRKEAPLVEDSDYYPFYSKVKKQINEEVSEGLDPKVAAQHIRSIMEDSNPTIKIKVGNFMQRNAVRIKNILPQKLFERMLMKTYGLGER